MNIIKIILKPLIQALSKLDNLANAVPLSFAIAQGTWFVLGKAVFTAIGKGCDFLLFIGWLDKEKPIIAEYVDPVKVRQADKEAMKMLKEGNERREKGFRAEQKQKYHQSVIEFKKKINGSADEYLRKIRNNN
jgi:hypothetical protein